MRISNYPTFLLLMFFSKITMAGCNSDRLSYDIKHVINAKPETYANGYYDSRNTALALENVLLCNEEKFDDLEVHVLHMVEWTIQNCRVLVTRPGARRPIYKTKLCAVHDDGMPKIKAGRSHYYLESIKLNLYFEANEFVRAELEDL